MSQDLIIKFRDQANDSFSDQEKKIMGVGGREKQRQALDETVGNDVVKSYNRPDASRPLKPFQGKNSDGELVFVFEDREDAVDLYNFFLETKLLEAGEVVFRNIEGMTSVAFMPHVMITKPEMVQAALMFYEDQMDIDMDDKEAYEDFQEFSSLLTDQLNEAERYLTMGAPKRKPGGGNPFHNKNTGKFSGSADQISNKGGSWAKGKTKLKFTGKGKGKKKGTTLVKFGSTKHPCGRAAREKGKDIRCWDGEKGAGFRTAKVMSKKKRAKEDLNIADLSLIMEMRAKYKIT